MAVSHSAQAAAVNRNLYFIESSRHQTQVWDGEGVLSAGFTDGHVHQYHRDVPQQDAVVVPLA